MKKMNKRGFTLIELIVVIAILAVLALILVPNVSSYIDKAKVAVNEANARSCFSAGVAELATGTKEADLNAKVNEMLEGASSGKCTVTVTTGVVKSATFTDADGNAATFPKQP